MRGFPCQTRISSGLETKPTATPANSASPYEAPKVRGATSCGTPEMSLTACSQTEFLVPPPTDLIATKQIDLSPIVDATFPLVEAAAAFERATSTPSYRVMLHP